MADGVNGINSGNSYIGNNFFNRPETKKNEEAVQPQVNNYEETQVDPDKIMDLLNQVNPMLIAPKSTSTTPVELSGDVQERVFDAMKDFETIYAVVAQEFGEKYASMIVNAFMDTKLGIV